MADSNSEIVHIREVACEVIPPVSAKAFSDAIYPGVCQAVDKALACRREAGLPPIRFTCSSRLAKIISSPEFRHFVIPEVCPEP